MNWNILGKGAAAALITVAGLSAAPAHAANETPWLIRVRALGVVPDESTSVKSSGSDISGAGASISTNIVPEIDISYFVTDNIAFELIAATTSHNVSGRGALAGSDLGSVSLLPPTLTVQYHFIPHGKVQPYVGAGLNYTIFYNENGGDFTDVDYDNGIGYALQAGFDLDLGNGWVANADVKKLWLNTKAKFNNGAVRAKIDIDPWIFGMGLGYHF